MPMNAIPDLPTPALLVDLDRVDANLRRAQAYADAQGTSLRPHTKTHKSPTFARRQLEEGAIGICVAKLGEAEVMIAAGIDDVFMANTTFGTDKAARAAALAQRARFSIGVDHARQLQQLSDAMHGQARPLQVMIEVDTGAGRGGVSPAAVRVLAQRARELPGIRLRGLYSYEGYTYGARDIDELTTVHRQAQATMAALATDDAVGFDEPPVVSMGSTPSLLANVPIMDGITEIRPGTYIFLDAAQARLAGGTEHCAAHVIATVVSVHPGRAILDAGSKTLTSDARAGGVTGTRGHGLLVDHDLVVTRLSEEHGVVEHPGADRLEVGEKVRILPNHVCPVVNLFPSMVLLRGGRVERELDIAARGCLS